MSGGSFSQGVGQWEGAAEVYDAEGRFAGWAHDTRTVLADDRAGRVTVDVRFDGPFSLVGTYTIADHGGFRTYEGPLNVGHAEALGDSVVAAHNYWPDLGLSQRFFLMVLPDGDHQLSLALLSRGERLCWTVVGEYVRRSGPGPLPDEPGNQSTNQPQDSPARPGDAAAMPDDPTVARGANLLHRAGRWSGRLTSYDRQREPTGTVDYTEAVDPAEAAGDSLTAGESGPAQPTGQPFNVAVSGLPHCGDVAFRMLSDDCSAWTPSGDVVGSATCSGGRAVSGQFHVWADDLRWWRREVAARDGSVKAVVHSWYRGEEHLGFTCGALKFHGP